MFLSVHQPTQTLIRLITVNVVIWRYIFYFILILIILLRNICNGGH